MKYIVLAAALLCFACGEDTPTGPSNQTITNTQGVNVTVVCPCPSPTPSPSPSPSPEE